MAKENASQERRRFGVVDFIIIVAVIAIIFACVMRYTINEGLFTRNDKTCTVSFSVAAVRYNTYDMLAENEKVYLSDFDLLGTLTSKNVTPAVFYAENNEGEIIEAHYPEKTLVDITGELLCKLSLNEGRYTASDGTHICPGATLVLHTESVDLTVLITGVDAVKAAEA